MVLHYLRTLCFATILLAGNAVAQSVVQSGSVTPNTATIWSSTGVVRGGVTATDSPLTSFGVTRDAVDALCVSSDRQTAAGRNQLCFQAGTSSHAKISLQNYGTAAAQSLDFVINGTTYPFPGSLANVTIGVTPVIGGTNSNCLFISGGVVGQQACTLSAITSLTGDVTATGPGVSAATLATVNVSPGTFGSGALVPIMTVNGKGLVTSVTTAPLAITVGSTTVGSGSTNGLLYNNGGVLGNLGTLASGVLITSAGGVPSIATTLPSALTIPSPTFTGTETFPDAATWSSVGISKVAALSVGSATLPSSGNVSVSGQYQINGTQISATTALSDGKTGTGALVGAASPAISGTWTGSPTFSGNITHSGQLIATGTSAPASAAGNSVVMGTIASPTLTNTGQAYLYNTVVNGAILEGDGSTNDVSLFNKSGTIVFGIPTGTTKLNFPSLSSGTCSSGLGLDSGNNTILVSCPGAAASVQIGTTSINSAGATNRMLTEGTVSGAVGTLSETPITANSSGDLASVNSISVTTSVTAASVAGSMVASKAQQQTGTSATNVVTPLHQQDHASAAKAWAYCTQSAGTYTLQASYNISGATCGKTGTGALTITFSTAFSTANFACVGTGAQPVSLVFAVAATTTTATVAIRNSSFLASDADFNVVCYGTQ